jgi:hypothetical protein
MNTFAKTEEKKLSQQGCSAQRIFSRASSGDDPTLRRSSGSLSASEEGESVRLGGSSKSEAVNSLP